MYTATLQITSYVFIVAGVPKSSVTFVWEMKCQLDLNTLSLPIRMHQLLLPGGTCCTEGPLAMSFICTM